MSRHWLFSLTLLAAYLLATPWFLYRAIRYGKRCRDWRCRFFGGVTVRSSNAPCIWFHAVSVGEVNLLSTVVEKLELRRPDVDVVISSTTKTGFDLARSKFPSHQVFYAPIDFHWAVKSVLRRIRPSMIVLSELELWPNIIGMAGRADVPVAVINARMSDSSFRGYQRFHWLLKSVFEKLSLVTTQTETDAERFAALGVDRSSIATTGSVKFDGASFDRTRPETLELKSLAGIEPNQIVFLAGSTQPGEEVLAAQTYLDLKPTFAELRLVIVPRHVERSSQVVNELSRLGINAVLRSHLTAAKRLSSDQVLIVDTIGELGFWWGLAQIGFVGGSFGKRGGQNMLEPTALEVATCFGPRTRNFRQIVQTLLDAKGAIQLASEADLAPFVRRCLEDKEWTDRLTQSGREAVAAHQGSTEKTIQLLDSVLPCCPATVKSAA